MRAMTLNALGALTDNPAPLRAVELPDPVPAPGEVLIKVHTCGICHTELDEIEGRMPPPRLPVVLGHQVVGRVAALAQGRARFRLGDRVGVAWIFSACGTCDFCRRGEENLCPHFRATGRDSGGGYAELMTVREEFAHRIPEVFTDAEAAPLLCAGAIGYRSLRLAGLEDGQNLGLTGFGASATWSSRWSDTVILAPAALSSLARRPSEPSPSNSAQPGPATPRRKPPRNSMRSLTPRPRGRPLSRRLKTWNPADAS